MLETLKHFFNVRNTVFIVAIDRPAICAHIKHFYGNDIDSSYYLSRLFDFEFELPVSNDFASKLVDHYLSPLMKIEPLLLKISEPVKFYTRHIHSS